MDPVPAQDAGGGAHPPPDRPADRRTFRRLDDETRFAGAIFRVVTRTVEAPDGSSFGRDIVVHSGAVAAVPVVERPDGTAVLMVRQYRAAVDGTVLEIPAGKRDVAGEHPVETMRRELEEEIGMRAGSLEELGVFFTSPGFSDERCHVFLARDLEPCPAGPHGPEEEMMEVVEVPLSGLWQLVSRREVTDAKSIIGLALAREALGTR